MKNCKVCEKAFVPIRSDALYCSVRCRNHSNNSKKRERLLPTITIDKQLHHNREILLANDGKTLSQEYLLSCGYIFNRYTGLEILKGKNSWLVYEFALMPLGDSYFKILRVKNEAA